MPGLLRGVARIAAIAGTATVVSNRVSRRQGQRWAADEQQQAPPAAPPAPAPGQTSTSADRIAAFLDLGELHTQGVLTDVGFNAEKAKIPAS